MDVEFEPIEFMKLHGSGNDFVVIDNRRSVLDETGLSAFSQLICRRARSIGADGVVLIEETADPRVDFRWRYFNADGSEGEMCGNGAMCGARFAALMGVANSAMSFSTMSGTVVATVDPDTGQVELDMPDTGPIETPRTVELDGRIFEPIPIQVGVPHAVLFVDDADAFGSRDELERIGRAIRQSDVFAPAGTNVDFVSSLGENRLRMRTYERGVEAETLACGTGAVASAVVSAGRNLVRSPVEIVTSSGMSLVASFDLRQNGASAVRLRGQTMIVMDGMIRPDALAR